MNDVPGYAVFFFPPALEALGDAIKPYLRDGPDGPHVPCREVDTAGAFVELTMQGETPDGQSVVVEVMVPTNMVRMIASVRSDTDFGFYNRNRPMVEPGMRAYTLPAVRPMPGADPAASPADAPPQAQPESPESPEPPEPPEPEPGPQPPADADTAAAADAPRPGA